MVYCTNCGEKIPKDAIFCPKCGSKAAISAESMVSISSDELRESFAKMSEELERAFNIAAKEIHDAFHKVGNSIQQNLNKEAIVCPNCGEKNPGTAVFCSKCGKKLEPKTTASPPEKT